MMNELGIENAFNLTGGILGTEKSYRPETLYRLNLLLYLIKHNIKKKKKK
jgi:hypothetical protein